MTRSGVRFPSAPPSFALRGSAGTTFRGPPAQQLSDRNVTSLQVIANSFRPVDVYGNPALAPETEARDDNGRRLGSTLSEVGGYQVGRSCTSTQLQSWSAKFPIQSTHKQPLSSKMEHQVSIMTE